MDSLHFIRQTPVINTQKQVDIFCDRFAQMTLGEEGCVAIAEALSDAETIRPRLTANDYDGDRKAKFLAVRSMISNIVNGDPDILRAMAISDRITTLSCFLGDITNGRNDLHQSENVTYAEIKAMYQVAHAEAKNYLSEIERREKIEAAKEQIKVLAGIVADLEAQGNLEEQGE